MPTVTDLKREENKRILDKARAAHTANQAKIEMPHIKTEKPEDAGNIVIELENETKRLHELVRLIVFDSENDHHLVHICVNGETFELKRGKWYTVPRYVEEVLKNAVIETARHEEDGLMMRVVPFMMIRYPYQVQEIGESLQDNQREAELSEELARIKAENAAFRAQLAQIQVDSEQVNSEEKGQKERRADELGPKYQGDFNEKGK